MEPARRLSPTEATRQITAMLEEGGLPMFCSTTYTPEIDDLQVTWAHGMSFHFDLSYGSIEPFDDGDREAILGHGMGCGCPPIDITVPGSPVDPREQVAIPGVNVRHVPELHPDDTAVVHGIPCTSISRTLIDLAEELPQEELRACFRRAEEMGILDAEALRASRARVEWRPSLDMLDEVIAEFVD